MADDLKHSYDQKLAFAQRNFAVMRFRSRPQSLLDKQVRLTYKKRCEQSNHNSPAHLTVRHLSIMPRKLSELEEETAQQFARETSRPLDAVRTALADEMDKLVAKKVRHYRLLKARRPEMQDLESELAETIARNEKQSGWNHEEAVASVVLGHLSMKRGLARLRRGRQKDEKSDDPLLDKILDEVSEHGDG